MHEFDRIKYRFIEERRVSVRVFYSERQLNLVHLPYQVAPHESTSIAGGITILCQHVAIVSEENG
jgi:hypothetical protein